MTLLQMLEGMGLPEDKHMPDKLNDSAMFNGGYNTANADVRKVLGGIEIDAVKIYSIIKGKKDGKVDFKLMSIAKAICQSHDILKEEE